METFGYHLTKTTYGTWLPGDARGSWLKDWSPQSGYSQQRRYSPPDVRREEMARRKLRFAPVAFTAEMIAAVVAALAECVERSQGGLLIMAATVEPTHIHLLLPDTGRDIDTTAKWLADRTTKAIHVQTTHTGPVWTSKNWCEHIGDQEHWEQALRYIDDHNVRAGRGSRPYAFLCPLEL